MTSELPYCLILPFQAFVLLNVFSVRCPENIYFEKSDWKHFKNQRIKRRNRKRSDWIHNSIYTIIKVKIIKQRGNHNLKHWKNVMIFFLNFVTFQLLWETSFHSFSCYFPISLQLHQSLLLPLNSVSCDFMSRADYVICLVHKIHVAVVLPICILH